MQNSATDVTPPQADHYLHAWCLLDSPQFVRYVRERTPAKPRLSPRACFLFHGIARTARRLRRVTCLPHAASDHMDGLCLSIDAGVQQLLTAGLIEEIPVAKADRHPYFQKCTWHLTPYGCAVLIAYAPPGACP